MTAKKHLFSIGLVAVLGWVSFFLVLYKMEPCTEAGKISICHSVSSGSLALFFLSSAVAMAGTFISLGFSLRLWFNKEIYREHLTLSIRQGLLLTFATIGGLVLLLINALTWWSGLLLIAIIMAIEFYFSRSDS
ncbi:hypothetical protein KBD59_03465 [Candidatus Gracilibacteria bacterium]|nr:hypothetical protein [Candidatus Gracilibacteria bacterium]